MHSDIIVLRSKEKNEEFLTDDASLYEAMVASATGCDYVDPYTDDNQKQDIFAGSFGRFGTVDGYHVCLDNEMIEDYLKPKLGKLKSYVSDLDLSGFKKYSSKWDIRKYIDDDWIYVYTDWGGLQTIDSFLKDMSHEMDSGDFDYQNWYLEEVYDYHF